MKTKKVLAGLLAVTVVAGKMVIAPVTAEAALAGSAQAGVFEGHTYAIFSEQMNWKDARDYCEKIGGHLVTITSEEENVFITETITRLQNGRDMHTNLYLTVAIGFI